MKKEKKERMIRVTRFRLRNEIREERYWETEEKRRCKLCEWELEMWEYVIEEWIGEEERGGREREFWRF